MVPSPRACTIDQSRKTLPCLDAAELLTALLPPPPPPSIPTWPRSLKDRLFENFRDVKITIIMDRLLGPAPGRNRTGPYRPFLRRGLVTAEAPTCSHQGNASSPLSLSDRPSRNQAQTSCRSRRSCPVPSSVLDNGEKIGGDYPLRVKNGNKTGREEWATSAS